MRVFMSWSGEKSRRLAEAFKKWLPGVLQAARPYFSPADIEKGARWASEVGKELEQSKFGLVFLTNDNLEAPWIMFEAGALSKAMDKSRVVPILFDLEPSDIKGPLVQFQAAPFGREHVLAVVKAINGGLEAPLQADVLDGVYAKWWPDIEKEVAGILAVESEGQERRQIRSDRELLEEVLALTRAMQKNAAIGGTATYPGAVLEAAQGFVGLVDTLDLSELSDDLRQKLRAQAMPLSFLVHRAVGREPVRARRAKAEMQRIVDLLRQHPEATEEPTEPGEDIPF